MNKEKVLIIVGFILIFTAGMFASQLLKDVEIMRDSTLEEIKYNASLIGYNTALSQIISETAKCQEPLKIELNNQTYSLFLVECLNLNNQEVK